MAGMKVLACDVHGPLVCHDGHLECVGFDGEAAGWCTAGGPDGISAEAAARVLSGQTRWPGVQVVSP